jgi:putative ABC transport system permease protein
MTAVGLRSIPHRLGNSLVIVVGIAGVTAVLISVLAMSYGFDRTIRADARSDRVLVLGQGVDSESNSSLLREQVAIVASSPGVRKDASGAPVASPEIVLVAPVARKGSGHDAYVTLRGVGDQVMRLRPEIEIIAGRMFEPGVREIVVGRAAQKQFAGLDVGAPLRLHDGDWKIVGVFAGGDNVRESEVMADVLTVMSSYKLDAYNSVTVLLESAQSYSTFKVALSAHPSMRVDALTEPAYLERVSRPMHRLLTVVAVAIGGIMAIGALCGALNTMYSAVSARLREIATFHALGFGAGAIVTSILIEALLLAMLGAIAGAAIAYAAFDGRTISTLGGTRWDSQLVYSLAVTPGLLASAAGVACAIGFVGGLFPALRAVRASVADALRTI